MDDTTSDLIRQVFENCRELTRRTGRPFSPDGHLVGSLGEVFAAGTLELLLMKPSNLGYDAIDTQGRKVEIKATTQTSVSLSAGGTLAERLVVVSFDDTGVGTIVYDGDANTAWDAAGPRQSNGQRRISLSTLQRIIRGTQDALFDIEDLPDT